jgi:hypothetical protein
MYFLFAGVWFILYELYEFSAQSNEKNSLPIFGMSKFCSASTITLLFSYLILIAFKALIKTEFLSSWPDYAFVNYRKFVVKKPFGFSKIF